MQQQSEITAQDAFDAARDRAAKTQEALILSEAQVMGLRRERDIALNRVAELERQVEELTAPDEGPSDATD
ncbi:MAG: hypothetical protein HOV73_01870 [Streptomyces sp.]|nr:hypothetical protein [Streptomyces sp.]